MVTYTFGNASELEDHKRNTQSFIVSFTSVFTLDKLIKFDLPIV